MEEIVYLDELYSVSRKIEDDFSRLSKYTRLADEFGIDNIRIITMAEILKLHKKGIEVPKHVTKFIGVEGIAVVIFNMILGLTFL